MGTDCYGAVYRKRSSGEWWPYAILDFDRDPTAFHALAGVFCDHPAAEFSECPVMLKAPAGLPEWFRDDLHWDSCKWQTHPRKGHHATWYKLAELVNSAGLPRAPLTDSTDLRAIVATMSALERGGHATALVVWFAS